MANKKATYYLTEQRGEKDRLEFTGEQVEENTTIQTLAGEALITPPHYIFTDSNGNRFGVAEADVKALYTRARDSKKESN